MQSLAAANFGLTGGTIVPVAEIIKLAGTSAWYAPGSAAAEMVEVILTDKKKIAPCSVFLQGEYGIAEEDAALKNPRPRSRS